MQKQKKWKLIPLALEQHQPSSSSTNKSKDGLFHLRELVGTGALGQQHGAEIDCAFMRKFVDIYLQKDESTLASLQRLIREHQRSEQIDSCSPLEVEYKLLSFYIQLLIRILQISKFVHVDASAMLARASVREFLLQYKFQLFCSQTDAFLPDCQPVYECVYELLSELQRTQPPEKWPFPLDLRKMIVAPLGRESTPLALRPCIERLAIQLLNEPRAGGASASFADDLRAELCNRLAEMLATADFQIVVESCARVFCACENIVEIAPPDIASLLINKAKQTKRIGHMFAELVAKLFVLRQKQTKQDLSSQSQFVDWERGFCTRFTHALVLTKLALELAKLATELANSSDNEVFQEWLATSKRRKAVLELLVNVSECGLNVVCPLLDHYRIKFEKWELTKLLKKLADKCVKPSSSFAEPSHHVGFSRSSDPGCRLYVQTLLNSYWAWLTNVLPRIVLFLADHVQHNSSALAILEGIAEQSKFFQTHYQREVKRFGWKLLQPLLCDEATVPLDTTLRILNICGPNHGLDEAILSDRLLAIATGQLPALDPFQQHAELAVKQLAKLFSNKFDNNLALLYQANAESDQVKEFILLHQVQCVSQPSTDDISSSSLIIPLLDQLDPEEEESPKVLRAAIQLFEAANIFEAIPRFQAKLTKLKEQLEMVEQRHKHRNREETDTRATMEDMLSAMESCTLDGSGGGHECGSKDCY